MLMLNYFCIQPSVDVTLIQCNLCVQPNASGSPIKTGTLQTRSVTASQLATDSPAKMNGHYSDHPGTFWDVCDTFYLNISPSVVETEGTVIKLYKKLL